MLKLTFTCDLPGRWVACDEEGHVCGFIDTGPTFARFTATARVYVSSTKGDWKYVCHVIQETDTFGEACTALTNFWVRKRLKDAGFLAHTPSPLHEHFAR